jgi:hypothetical protein
MESSCQSFSADKICDKLSNVGRWREDEYWEDEDTKYSYCHLLKRKKRVVSNLVLVGLICLSLICSNWMASWTHIIRRVPSIRNMLESFHPQVHLRLLDQQLMLLTSTQCNDSLNRTIILVSLSVSAHVCTCVCVFVYLSVVCIWCHASIFAAICPYGAACLSIQTAHLRIYSPIPTPIPLCCLRSDGSSGTANVGQVWDRCRTGDSFV